MTRLIWFGALVLLAVWSLFAWGAWWLLDAAAAAASGGIGSLNLPPIVQPWIDWLGNPADWEPWLAWLARLVQGVGAALMWLLWGAGALALALGAWLLARLARAVG